MNTARDDIAANPLAAALSELRAAREVRRVVIAMIAVLLASACTRSESGGYAAPCHLKSSDGWIPTSYDSLQRSIGSNIVDLSAAHLYYSAEAAALIEVPVFSFNEPGRHEIFINPDRIYMDLDGERFFANKQMRENPFMKNSWRCGGQILSTDAVSRCGPAVLTFREPIPPGHGFTLHLETLRVDGRDYAVPDIEFCYIPHEAHWVKFHG